MRLTLAGRLMLFVVIASALYYAWTRFAPPAAKEQLTELRQRLPGGGGTAPRGATEGGGGAGGEAPRVERAGDLLFITTAAKKDWVGLQVDNFNRAPENNGRWRVLPRPMPSREAMHAILDGKVQPVLWSPGGPMWPGRLAEAWTQRHGSRVLDTTDPAEIGRASCRERV